MLKQNNVINECKTNSDIKAAEIIHLRCYIRATRKSRRLIEMKINRFKASSFYSLTALMFWRLLSTHKSHKIKLGNRGNQY